MHAGIGHVLAPEELAQRRACAPEHHLVIVDAVKLKGFQYALMRVVAVNVALANDGAKLVGGVDGALVHVNLNAVPVVLVNELGQIDLTHHGRHDMRVLKMEVVVRTIEVSGHHCDIIGAILQVVALTHLQAGNLRDGILLIGVFQR